MRSQDLYPITVVLILVGIFGISVATANPNANMQAMHGKQKMYQGGMGYRQHMMHRSQHKKHGHHGKNAKLLGPHWKQTLTQEQKLHIDRMHLDFAKAKMSLKSKIRMLKVELALLSTAEAPSADAIEKKIEELLEVKRNTMRIRAEHIAKMRQALNSQQRVSFDLDVLNRANRKRSGNH